MRKTWRPQAAQFRPSAAKTAYDQIRPSTAKALFNHFRAKDILDLSMGWGDRLAGFHAAKETRSYTGTDPNSALQAGYRAQDECYATGKKTKFYDLPAEDLNLKKSSFDLMFTSPPYFDREKYEGPNQSRERYKPVEDWLNKFLFVTLEKAYWALRDDGILIVNLADINDKRRKGEAIKLCDPMNDFLRKLGASYVGCWGLRLAKRPQSMSDREGIFAEPLWIWQRGAQTSTTREELMRAAVADLGGKRRLKI